MKKLGGLIAALLLFGCAANTKVVGTTVLPTSHKAIDVVQHRSDNRGCAEQVVLQTYDSEGNLIDSKSAQANALHCQVIGAGIQAGGIVGAAAVLRPSRTTNSNSNSQGQVQVQGQKQATTNTNTNTASGGAGGQGGQGGQGGNGGGEGQGGGSGNNGGGNGTGDGTNPGTDHSHTPDNN